MYEDDFDFDERDLVDEEYPLRKDINTSIVGHNELGRMYHNCRNYGIENIDLILPTFFEANMSAVLLAMAHQLAKEDIHLGLSLENDHVLVRNGLVNSLLGEENPQITDRRQSTVPLRTFGQEEDDAFTAYIHDDFLGHRGNSHQLPYNLVKSLTRRYQEIFSNVALHAETTEPIYTCGQYFPGKKKFVFTLCDVGIGFLNNVSNFDNNISTSLQAIEWALQGNSTKTEAKGGLGLSTILSECMNHMGELHIVSGDCYWKYCPEKGKTTYHLEHEFPGTTVHLVFRY
ncbi:hypothetical protein AB9P05_23085 [Roseivirga sp. BDSF3-8]|uniref:hypothetical protein n=1 Tax=Roseivirga sp. BDSF3-8 TaxID=3241598 RepID=UPI003531ECD0